MNFKKVVDALNAVKHRGISNWEEVTLDKKMKDVPVLPSGYILYYEEAYPIAKDILKIKRLRQELPSHIRWIGKQGYKVVIKNSGKVYHILKMSASDKFKIMEEVKNDEEMKAYDNMLYALDELIDKIIDELRPTCFDFRIQKEDVCLRNTDVSIRKIRKELSRSKFKDVDGVSQKFNLPQKDVIFAMKFKGHLDEEVGFEVTDYED